MSATITPNNRLAKEKSESLVLAAMREKGTFVVSFPYCNLNRYLHTFLYLLVTTIYRQTTYQFREAF
ncbi:hypothetical protein [Alteromonas portus]|uniref:hypothetical protein n=1 Tax=Alteromonas portus TaxID=2565549 RepID=UPI003BF78A37